MSENLTLKEKIQIYIKNRKEIWDFSNLFLLVILLLHLALDYVAKLLSIHNI